MESVACRHGRISICIYTPCGACISARQSLAASKLHSYLAGSKVYISLVSVLLCRVWFAKVAESAEGLICSVLPSDLHTAAVELAPYLIDSIGNSTRIDYGTGHETTFCALLCCLAKLGVLNNDDLQVSRGVAQCIIG